MRVGNHFFFLFKKEKFEQNCLLASFYVRHSVDVDEFLLGTRPFFSFQSRRLYNTTTRPEFVLMVKMINNF